MLHNNWFLTVFEKNIIPIVWVTLVISAALTGATYLVDPIYSAKTELILDASLERILPYMQEGFPTTNSGDYIRAEYFAIDSINLMQQPKIGEKVIIDNKLSDNNGDKIDVDSFINPSVLELLFSTGGQGVTVKWISDTQQFSVTGYGKDIHTAAMLSTQYTNAFLENDKKQFNNILKNLKKRNEIILNSALIKELAVINEQAALRKKYGVANWSERIEDVTAALAVVEDRIFSEEIEKSTSTARLKEYEKQLRELKKPVHLSETEQKSELLATLQDTLTTLVTELAAASIEFTPNHPDYRKIQKKIDVIRQQIANETKREYLQSTHSTSSALDSILTNIMEIRVNQEVRTIKLNEFNRLKEEYLNGLNFLGNGEAAYSDLTVQKTKLNDIKQSAMQDVLKIGALLEHPFSFFRVTSEPFIDINNIDSAKFFPNRKLTLVVSLTGVFMICFFFYFYTRTAYRNSLFCLAVERIIRTV